MAGKASDPAVTWD